MKWGNILRFVFGIILMIPSLLIISLLIYVNWPHTGIAAIVLEGIGPDTKVTLFGYFLLSLFFTAFGIDLLANVLRERHLREIDGYEG